MSTPYIPARDADFANWLANFSSTLTATPALYGLQASDATAVATVAAAWVAAYALAVNPSTRTPTTVQGKNVAKLDALSMVRPYAQLIAGNSGVSSSAKIAIGVNPRVNPPTPVAAPTTHPVITIPSMSPLTHVVRYRDELASPSSKAKPAGATALELYCTVSATPITDPAALTFAGLQTKAPFQHEFNSADAGKIAYYAGRWVTRKGLTGPWSAVASATVAA